MQFDQDKFRRLLHYVIAKAGDIDGFGATKLYKVLWFSDARAFMLFGEPLTGETYVREKYGPMPRHIFAALHDLQQSGAITVKQSRWHGRPTRKFKSLTSPDILPFDEERRKIVDFFIHHIAHDHTANSISEESHDLAWEIAKQGEDLPYRAIFANRIREPNDEERAWGIAKAKALGLN